jgi:two-component system sensor histidine kinase DesK
LQLSAEARRNIFLVAKEAMHNVVKHSKATEAVLRFTLVEQKMEIVLHDNGIGFSLKDATSLGNGLHSMKERMEDVGGRFVIESEPRCGTTVSLSVPLKSRTTS